LARGRGDRWLLGERRYYLLNLGVAASLAAAVRLARSRWPIEQQYRELKDELGFDHFEGRSWPGWTHHVVLTAMAFTFLQSERLQYPATAEPTLPHVRMWLREIVAVL
jgi:SRSO17 transposase